MSDIVYLAIMADPHMPMAQRKQEKAYKDYVDEHVKNVKIAWEKMKENKDVMDYLDSIYVGVSFLISSVDDQIRSHDSSKYGIDEWEPYRKNFYPVDDQEKEDNIADFQKAWEHHYNQNMHHWDWWAKSGNKDAMGLNFVIEMCCDWAAMSMKFGGDAYHWYLKQKDIKLGERQKEWVVNILKKLYGIKE